jgi:hypothetical protein
VSRNTVHRVVSESIESFADARIRSFVLVLVRRMARQWLRSLAERSA